MKLNNFGQLWENGPTPGSFYNFPGKSADNQDYMTKYQHDSQRGNEMVTTGSSVIGMKFDNGVVIAADNLVSYGSTARFNNCARVMKVNDQIVLGCGGDYADFQHINFLIETAIISDFSLDDNLKIKPKALFEWMTRLLYKQRSEMAPLWVELLIGGMQDGEPFLGHVSVRGKAYSEDIIATGYGAHLTLPVIREYKELKGTGPVSKEDASGLLKKCMEILYYRDCRAYPFYTQAFCTLDANKISNTEVVEHMKVDENWAVAKKVTGYN